MLLGSYTPNKFSLKTIAKEAKDLGTQQNGVNYL